MARSLNQVTLMGNLTRDPELRTTPNGQNVVSFSLALNRSYKDQNDEWQEVTDFVDIVAWGSLAERVSQYLNRGSRCLVQGRLQSRSWEQEGQKRSKVEVLASDVTFLDNRGSADSDQSQADIEVSQNDSKKSAKSKKSDKKDVVIEDIGDEPINLDEIPF
jgi:single-strand DNA-binding protein